MKTISGFIAVLLITTTLSCQQENVGSNEIKTIELDEKSAQLVEADNTFGLEIFQKIREESTKENIMISPLSISIALAMTYNGANGDTKAEMENVLHLNGLTPEEINFSYQSLILALQSLDEDVVFKIANAIFYTTDFSVKPDFIQTNKTYYDAEIEQLDFLSPEALETINGWVAEKTNNKIQKIIEQLSPMDRMILLNAIYFNGIWSTRFDENGTKLRDFRKSDGTVLSIPTMNKEEKLDYTSNDLFEAVKMPYGNGQYNMIVMLPANNKNLQNIIDEFSVDKWKSWNGSFETKEHVEVTMPRFKFAFDFELKNILKSMGMPKAFNPLEANFSGISNDGDLHISSVIHKSYIDVNENGTEAAAVTAVTISVTSAGPGDNQKIYFTVDKPFVFAITEKDTEAILFIGEVQNPVYED